MSAVDQLLVFLLDGKSRVAQEMISVGFTEDQMRVAGTKLEPLGSPNRRGWVRTA